MSLGTWATRYRIKRPFSRRLRVKPAALIGTVAPDLDRFAADPAFDPLSGTLDFLIATYAGDAARSRRALDRLGRTGTAQSLTQLLAENDLRKLVIACFREALRSRPVDRERAGLLLDFSKRFDPAFALIAETPSVATAPSHPLSFEYAPRLPETLRIVILCKPPESARPHDLGERLLSAFIGLGIDCAYLPGEIDPKEIGANDLVLVDESAVFRKDHARQQAHLDKVRKVARRMGRLIPDPWGKGFREQLARGADRYDFHWAIAPSLREDGAIPPDRFCLIPFPCGFGRLFDEIAATPGTGFGFCGAIEDYNLHRYFWVLSALAGAADLNVDITSQQADGLDPEASLKVYLGRLLRSQALLSLTMRSTGDRILVGRTFDALRGGRLLVQEYTPDARYYLTPDEDFIEVAGIGDVARAADRIRAGEGEAIRRHGAETFRRSYSDEAVVRHLATWL